MAKVKIDPTARRAFDAGFTAMMQAHLAVDNVIAEVGAAQNNAPINIDRLVLVLSHQMANSRVAMLNARNVAGAQAVGQQEVGATYDFQGAIDETVARIDALLAWIQTNAPASDVGGRKMLHFWELLPDGSVRMETRTKQQLINAGLNPLLQGFVADRI